MGKYEHYSKKELIRQIESLETQLHNAVWSETTGQGKENGETEDLQQQRRINFLNILMDTILSNLFVVVVVKDVFDEFKYIYFNKAAEEFTGKKASDIIGRTDFDLFPDIRRAHEIRTEDFHVMKAGRSDKFMVEYEKPDGEIRIVNLIRLLITNPDPGASPLLLVMLSDITEHRQHEIDLHKAREADKMKNTFIANMSHEIRTPLNAIVGFSRLIMETTNVSEQMEYYTIINNNCDMLLQLINDILDFSKIESGTLNYNMTEVEVKDICQGVYVTQSLKMTSDVALLYNADALPSVRIRTDPQRVEQVLLNLLSNATKCTTVGFISLSYEVGEKFVKIMVVDTGVGIPDEKQASIFERFVKLDDFRQGTGLGLSICKMIVERLGGEIGLISKVGVGSTFWFTLPLNFSETETARKDGEAIVNLEEMEDALPGQFTILIAEDVFENYLLLQAVLKKQYRLIHATDGEDAVEMYRTYRPDLILMDIKMPRMDGFEATREIRKIALDVPVLALTAFAFEKEKQKASEYGFSDYLVKPVDILLLKHKIKYHLNKTKI